MSSPSMTPSSSQGSVSSNGRSQNNLSPPGGRTPRCPHCAKAVNPVLCEGKKTSKNKGRSYSLCLSGRCPRKVANPKDPWFWWFDKSVNGALFIPSPMHPHPVPGVQVVLRENYQPASLQPTPFLTGVPSHVDKACAAPGCHATRVNKKCPRDMCAPHCRQSGGCKITDHRQGTAQPAQPRRGAVQLSQSIGDPFYPVPDANYQIYNAPSSSAGPFSQPSASAGYQTQMTSTPSLTLYSNQGSSSRDKYVTTMQHDWRNNWDDSDMNVLAPVARSNSAHLAHADINQINLYLYHRDDIPADVITFNASRDQQRTGIRLSNISVFAQFLQQNQSPEEFLALLQSVLRVFNVTKKHWVHFSYQDGLLFPSAKEFRPLIISVPGCKRHVDLDEILRRVKKDEAGFCNIGTQQFAPAARVSQAISQGEPVSVIQLWPPNDSPPPSPCKDYSPSPSASSVSVHCVTPSAQSSRRAPTPVSNRDWFDQISMHTAIIAFGILRGKDKEVDGNLLARGCALLGPNFKRSTFSKHRDFWDDTPHHRRDKYTRKAHSNAHYSWKMFKTMEKAARVKSIHVFDDDEDASDKMDKGKGKMKADEIVVSEDENDS